MNNTKGVYLIQIFNNDKTKSVQYFFENEQDYNDCCTWIEGIRNKDDSALLNVSGKYHIYPSKRDVWSINEIFADKIIAKIQNSGTCSSSLIFKITRDIVSETTYVV